jgi:hypothetical protein
MTDGPFAETTEQLGGYFLIDVTNLDEAIAIAGRIPAASKGTVESRPVVEFALKQIVISQPSFLKKFRL